MTDFIVIIPARLNSTRLPGKALADIDGKPMVQHVYEQACKSRAARVIVATDHPDIFKAVEAIGGNVLMTSSAHVSGTDRLAECVNQLALDDDEIIVNVQGDEPLVPPEIINQVARNLATRPAAGMATLCEPIREKTEFFNPNVVKVVYSESGMALYFSRARFPGTGPVSLVTVVTTAAK
jgi:3-deoxy-manno-octulosonate cytidylyltransferase (CMP-KDO synthetase)